MGTRWRLARPGKLIALIAVAALLVASAAIIFVVAPVRYSNLVTRSAAAHHLSPALVAAVIRVESSYRPAVVSPHGAVGLMQLMPTTAHWILEQGGGGPGISKLDLRVPDQNIALGSWYLAYLLGRYANNVILALAAYNSGPAVTDGWIQQGRLHWNSTSGVSIPYVETRNFVARVFWYRRFYTVMYGIRHASNTGHGG